MEKSEESKDLFTALAKALGEMTAVPLDAVNPHFKSKYATLAATQDIARAPLSKNGLALIQSVETDGDNYFVESMITHSTGQFLKSKMKLILFKADMQGLGSATTYAKRYAAQALLGLSGDEDDDGNAASAPPGQKPPVQKSQPLPPRTNTTPPKKAVPQNFAPASAELIERINGLCMDRGVSEGCLHYLITNGYGFAITACPTWVANEIGKLLEHEDTNEAKIMGEAQRVLSRREAKNLLSNPQGGTNA